MKIIQDRELVRILTMLESNEKSMRDLGVSILKKNDLMRVSFLTMGLLHSTCLLFAIIAGIFIAQTWHLGLYWLPLILSWVIQVAFSICYLVVTAQSRQKYNDTLKE